MSGKNKFNINDITTNLVTLTGTEDNFNLKYLYPNNIVDILTNFESGKQYAFSDISVR